MNRNSLVIHMVILLGVFVLFASCSKDDNPVNTNPPEASYIWVHFLEDSVKISFDALTKIDAGGVEAIQKNSESLSKGACCRTAFEF